MANAKTDASNATAADRAQKLVARPATPANAEVTEDVLSRLRAEFLEMPGMRLTPDQVQRLCGVERALCRLALDALVASKFLCVKADGHYARVTDGGDMPSVSRESRPQSRTVYCEGIMTESRHRHVQLGQVLAVASTDCLNHKSIETRN